MKLIKDQGGHSIAVYKPRASKKKKVSEKLINENRVNFACPADYAKDSEIFQVVKTILEKVKADYDFQSLLNQHQKKLLREDKKLMCCKTYARMKVNL